MSDTLGSLIDKLNTVDMKMFATQDEFYVIRKLSYEEFVEQFASDEEKLRKLYEVFHRGIDLNLQRNNLIKEIDEKLVEMFMSFARGEDLDSGRFIQRPYKTYG